LQITDREAGITQLLLIQKGEEVGLVLVPVGALPELDFGFRIALDPPRVVPRGHGLEAMLLRPISKHAELDFAIAHHIRIRRQAALVAGQQVVDDAVTVLLHQVHDAELDLELLADVAGIVDVLHPRAVADDFVLVDPILHVGPDDVVPLLLQAQCGDGAVDAAGHGDEQFRLCRN